MDKVSSSYDYRKDTLKLNYLYRNHGKGGKHIMDQKVIAISTNKGGVLKTSITTNLAGVFAARGEKVLIIDTDNQGNVAITFGENPDEYEKTLYDVLVEGMPATEVIVNVAENIDLIACNDDMTFFEFDVLTRKEEYPNIFKLLKNAIEPLLDRYDRILIDTPPNLGLTQGNVLAACDGVLIPFHPEKYSMRSLTKILKAVRQFKEQHNENLEVIGVVATLVNKRTTLHKHIITVCKDYAMANEIRFFKTSIPLSVQFASSVAFEEMPITIAQPNSDHASHYFDLVKEIEKQPIKK